MDEVKEFTENIGTLENIHDIWARGLQVNGYSFVKYNSITKYVLCYNKAQIKIFSVTTIFVQLIKNENIYCHPNVHRLTCYTL